GGVGEIHTHARTRRRNLALLPDSVYEEPWRPRRRNQTPRPLPVRRLGLRAWFRTGRILAAVQSASRIARDPRIETGRALVGHGHRRAGWPLHRSLCGPDDAAS